MIVEEDELHTWNIWVWSFSSEMFAYLNIFMAVDLHLISITLILILTNATFKLIFYVISRLLLKYEFLLLAAYFCLVLYLYKHDYSDCGLDSMKSSWTHPVSLYLAFVPAGNRLTALMSSWRSSSFQPFPPPPPPPLACSALRDACLAWISASLSFCSWAFTSCTWREEHQHVCENL